MSSKQRGTEDETQHVSFHKLGGPVLGSLYGASYYFGSIVGAPDLLETPT